MGTEIFFFAIILLAGLAIFDLVVGVTNDAVNFLNSPIGCRAAPRTVILIVASLGIIAGVTFSGGMMEVARKGIFHPQFFTMPELITIFLAVMLTDVILLDSFSTRGLPTSTTVSIVFELLGAAVAVSMLKIVRQGDDLASLAQYINTSKAIVIILAILLSVVVAFVCGTIAQMASRLLFTFDYATRLKRYGALWGGIALSSITYFILVKGAKGTSFMTPDSVLWIKSNTLTILLTTFAVSAVILQLLIFLSVNILKIIILLGTFALAMAFAANDLVNFIGVPMAAYHAYTAAAAAAANPLEVTMGMLGNKVTTETPLLLAAGFIMVLALWISKKARTVIQTGVGLSQQAEGEENFDSTFLSRAIVRTVIRFGDTVARITPASIRRGLAARLNPANHTPELLPENRPAFDLLRGSVNLMVASAVVSYATSYKLPLSTTYVTFMVAMGTSFADQAWGRENAVYRVTGVLTVIGGWFITAFLAFLVSCSFAAFLFYAGVYGVVVLVALVGLFIWMNHHQHVRRTHALETDSVFNLTKVKDVSQTVSTTFEHMGHLVREIHQSLDRTFDGLFTQNRYILQAERRKTKEMQRWGNIIAANIFKAMRLLQERGLAVSPGYAQTGRRIQKLIDGHRDIVLRACMHVGNYHQGLLAAQIEELENIRKLSAEIFSETEASLNRRQEIGLAQAVERDRCLREFAEEIDGRQMLRIQDGTSKTRLSLMYYAIHGNMLMLCRQNLRLLEIFKDSFGKVLKPQALREYMDVEEDPIISK